MSVDNIDSTHGVESLVKGRNSSPSESFDIISIIFLKLVRLGSILKLVIYSFFLIQSLINSPQFIEIPIIRGRIVVFSSFSRHGELVNENLCRFFKVQVNNIHTLQVH
jgi:hypothetical protein